jgi:hypothetical protein
MWEDNIKIYIEEIERGFMWLKIGFSGGIL